MTLFLWLLTSHFMGDFLLQPKSWTIHKLKEKIFSSRLYIHILIHGVLASVVLFIDPFYWWIPILVMISHYLIDLGKIYSSKYFKSPLLFIIDQLLHIIVIVLLAYYVNPKVLNFNDIDLNSALLLIVVILFISNVSGVIVKELIKPFTPEANSDPNKSLSNAGKIIGILERLFVFIFVVTNHWEGVGFLIAAKSILRFGDLKEARSRKLTEYVLIGTLISFGLAFIGGLFYNYFVNII
ncbi:DUF3307 domain-containing protein [Mangrovivirga sp. M17]|uniref:DUF3307 domain-containing protein n=1 Tax=Mangrovivirga halotolerans TaxID=2993936 RepID=A0ABT3RQR4_9BACT|nr:DUF3307 domain-containing protein [Mangrovivirga halotolerans]MCX2743955.1 DUF3307 domain-containing protein [Mangrovivirga halotolerans]